MKSLIAVLCAALVLMAGCGDEDSECVNCPSVLKPTLDNIWPNVNGTTWGYQHDTRMWLGTPTIYPTEGQVPDLPLPAWSEVFEFVETAATVDPYESSQGTMSLHFDGMMTTQGGVRAQNLVQEIIVPVAAASSARSAPGGFFNRPWGAGVRLLKPGLAPMVNEGPIFLHGGPWEKNSSWIGTYGDLGREPEWKYLTSKLAVGSEFSYRILPQFADDIFLHCRVHREITVETEVGDFKKALDCLYILDWGTGVIVDLQGDVLGYLPLIELGRVIYAPTIGPVYCYDALVEPGIGSSLWLGDLRELLVSTSLVEN